MINFATDALWIQLQGRDFLAMLARISTFVVDAFLDLAKEF